MIDNSRYVVFLVGTLDFFAVYMGYSVGTHTVYDNHRNCAARMYDGGGGQTGNPYHIDFHHIEFYFHFLGEVVPHNPNCLDWMVGQIKGSGYYSPHNQAVFVDHSMASQVAGDKECGVVYPPVDMGGTP